MKVILVNPKQLQGIQGVYPSLGIAYIASALTEKGIDTKIWDLPANRWSETKFEIQLEEESPNIVGITANSFTFPEAKKLAGIIKRKNNQIKVVLGGPHVTLYPTETLLHPEFDFAFFGEAEVSFPNFIEALNNQSLLSGVKGLVYRENGKITCNSPQEPIVDLDKISFPARHLIPMEKYFSPIARASPYHIMITSRGCPFSCTYCAPSLEGKKFRMRSPTNTVDEIEELVLNYGIKELQFYDDSLSVNKNRVMQICDEITRRELKFQWDARTRVDIVDENLLKKMKGAGCTRIRYGIESGDQRILDIMNKNTTLEQIEQAVALTRDIGGIEILTYFMIGTPGETLNTIHRTIDLAKRLNPDHVRFNITNANPGTQMYKDALEKGIFKEDYWLHYAQGRLIEIPNLVFETEEYTRRDLEKLVKYAYQECKR